MCILGHHLKSFFFTVNHGQNMFKTLAIGGEVRLKLSMTILSQWCGCWPGGSYNSGKLAHPTFLPASAPLSFPQETFIQASIYYLLLTFLGPGHKIDLDTVLPSQSLRHGVYYLVRMTSMCPRPLMVQAWTLLVLWLG